MDNEVTKNQKRKKAIRQLAEAQGVGVARAGLINDRERSNSVDSQMCECQHPLEWHLGREYIQEKYNDSRCTVCSACEHYTAQDARLINAWGTEWEEYVVWGTHSAEPAMAAVRKHLIEDVGETPEIIDELTPDHREFSTARKYWGSPDLPDNDELWPKHKFSTEYRDGWVPWMVISVGGHAPSPVQPTPQLEVGKLAMVPAGDERCGATLTQVTEDSMTFRSEGRAYHFYRGQIRTIKPVFGPQERELQIVPAKATVVRSARIDRGHGPMQYESLGSGRTIEEAVRNTQLQLKLSGKPKLPKEVAESLISRSEWDTPYNLSPQVQYRLEFSNA